MYSLTHHRVSAMYNIEESRMYSTYDYTALTGKAKVHTYDIFHLQFHNCYIFIEYKPLLKQCRI